MDQFQRRQERIEAKKTRLALVRTQSLQDSKKSRLDPSIEIHDDNYMIDDYDSDTEPDKKRGDELLKYALIYPATLNLKMTKKCFTSRKLSMLVGRTLSFLSSFTRSRKRGMLI